jgi:5-methylthioadenosine/S-adenosylhomocysteine deaminase
VIDCKGRLVIPGLVDTHRHVWQGAIGAFTPQMTGAGYGPAVLNGISTRYEPEDIYAGALWGALQALDAGITTIADWAHNLRSAEHVNANLRGLQESGIRGYFLYGGPGPTTDAPNPPHPQDARRMRDEHFPILCDPAKRNIGHIYLCDLVTCSETCSTSAEMPSDRVADCAPKTEFSAIYGPGIVS